MADPVRDAVLQERERCAEAVRKTYLDALDEVPPKDAEIVKHWLAEARRRIEQPDPVPLKLVPPPPHTP